MEVYKMKMLSFAAENYSFDALNKISIVTGLSRSELLREGLRNIILHYSVEESFDDSEPSMREMMKQILQKLQTDN